MTDNGRELMERNVRNLNEGIKRARPLVDAMLDYDAEGARVALESLLELQRSLDDDAREQMTIAAFTTIVQMSKDARERGR